MTTPIDRLAENHRKRTFPAKLLDEDSQILAEGEARLGLAEGEARLGIESDPANIFYPNLQQILPNEVVARASYIEIADSNTSRVRVHLMELCEGGSEIHYHFQLPPTSSE